MFLVIFQFFGCYRYKFFIWIVWSKIKKVYLICFWGLLDLVLRFRKAITKKLIIHISLLLISGLVASLEKIRKGVKFIYITIWGWVVGRIVPKGIHVNILLFWFGISALRNMGNIGNIWSLRLVRYFIGC